MWNPIRRFRRGRVTFTQLQLLYVFALFLALYSNIPTFANSSFLETFLSEEKVGIVFSIASIFTLFALVNLPRLLGRFGIYKTAVSLIVADIVVLITLGLSSSIPLTLGAFILHLFFVSSLFYTLDIFVENLSAPERTGTIRGTLLTVLNTAVLVSPLILSLLLGKGEQYSLMYIVSASILIIPLIILTVGFRNFKDPVYEKVEARKTTMRILGNSDLFNIFVSGFLLRFFYAWMIIYTPLYLINVMGFNWSTLGPVFTFMLLPFVLFQIPLGLIADKKLGEQELLITGFIITGLATIALSFISTPHIIVWAVILFTTRLGASFIEAMTESYFFKQVGPSDTSLVSLYRTVGPLSYVVAPIISTLALLVIDIKYTFVVLGTIILTGIIFALGIRDSR